MSYNIEELKKQYPKGTRVELISMSDDFGVKPGTLGTVDFIDSIGSINMKWDNGSMLSLIPEIDKFKKI